MRWFRMYSEFAYDPKVQSMDETSQRRFLIVLCLQCDGSLKQLTDSEIAVALRIGEDDLLKTKELFVKKGFIDDQWGVLHWDKRQYNSDTSTPRTRTWRERKNAQKSDGNKTSQERHKNSGVTSPDTDTDTDTDIKKERKIFSSDMDEMRLARFMFAHIKRNNPNAKEPRFESWAIQFDFMIRLDKRAVDDIKAVIDWSQKDDFWKANILSPDKLRKKFDQLWIKMTSKPATKTDDRKWEV